MGRYSFFRCGLWARMGDRSPSERIASLLGIVLLATVFAALIGLFVSETCTPYSQCAVPTCVHLVYTVSFPIAFRLVPCLFCLYRGAWYAISLNRGDAKGTQY